MRRGLILAIVLAGLLVGTAQGANWQVHSGVVEVDRALVWESNRQFRPTDAVETAVYVDGHELANTSMACDQGQIGHGVVVTVNLCGNRPVPLRLRAATLDGTRHRVTLAYRLLP